MSDIFSIKSYKDFLKDDIMEKNYQYILNKKGFIKWCVYNNKLYCANKYGKLANCLELVYYYEMKEKCEYCTIYDYELDIRKYTEHRKYAYYALMNNNIPLYNHIIDKYAITINDDMLFIMGLKKINMPIDKHILMAIYVVDNDYAKVVELIGGMCIDYQQKNKLSYYIGMWGQIIDDDIRDKLLDYNMINYIELIRGAIKSPFKNQIYNIYTKFKCNKSHIIYFVDLIIIKKQNIEIFDSINYKFTNAQRNIISALIDPQFDISIIPTSVCYKIIHSAQYIGKWDVVNRILLKYKDFHMWDTIIKHTLTEYNPKLLIFKSVCKTDTDNIHHALKIVMKNIQLPLLYRFVSKCFARHIGGKYIDNNYNRYNFMDLSKFIFIKFELVNKYISDCHRFIYGLFKNKYYDKAFKIIRNVGFTANIDKHLCLAPPDIYFKYVHKPYACKNHMRIFINKNNNILDKLPQEIVCRNTNEKTIADIVSHICIIRSSSGKPYNRIAQLCALLYLGRYGSINFPELVDKKYDPSRYSIDEKYQLAKYIGRYLPPAHINIMHNAKTLKLITISVVCYAAIKSRNLDLFKTVCEKKLYRKNIESEYLTPCNEFTVYEALILAKNGIKFTINTNMYINSKDCNQIIQFIEYNKFSKKEICKIIVLLCKYGQYSFANLLYTSYLPWYDEHNMILTKILNH